MSEGEKKSSARAAFNEGIDLQDKGKPAEALRRFEAAQSLFDAPTHLLHIAECQALIGKLVEAQETYTTLDNKNLAGQADVFKQAQTQGHAELQALKPRVPTLKVVIHPDPQTLQSLVVTLNEQQVPGNVATVARPVNPGTYRATATATGYATPQAQTFTLQEKEQKTIELTLAQGAIGASVATAPPTTAPPTTGPAQQPAPYEQQASEAKPKPTPFGLLLGAKALVMVPLGKAASGVDFSDIATAGPGFGLEGYLRFARILYGGINFEWAKLGGPSDVAAGVDVSSNMYYVGAAIGIVPNIDRVSFIGDVGLGYRHLGSTVSGATGVGSVSGSVGGANLALGAGLSIPIGPVRLIPKLGLAFGSFGDESTSSRNGNNIDDAVTNNSATHLVFTFSLGIAYSANFGKKPTGP